MANIKSAKKAIRVTAKVTDNNHELKAKVKNVIKDCEKAITEKDLKLAKDSYSTVQKTIDKAQAKGLVKKNTAAREKARLNDKIKAMNK
jgi:small subunit ribosomal protein S20